jgi:predicted PurR-regulated permease PerM
MLQYNKRFSIQNIAYFLLTMIMICYIMIIGKFFIIPFFFAVLLSMLMLPIQHFFDRYISSQTLSTLLAFLSVLIPIAAIITFFSVQVSIVIGNLDNISLKVQSGAHTLFQWISDYFNISPEESQNILKNNISKFISSPITIFQSSVNSFAVIMLDIALIFLFMFFLLAYRKAIKNFILMQFSPTQREAAGQTVADIQNMLGHYLSGLFIVMLVLAVMNSIGLWFIGIDYPLLWASLAAFLTIIPYIGTTLGGGLPFFYALATAESWHQPAAVVIMYATVQQLEGNVITPFIVGSKVRINPLVAIIGILLMNALWGIIGIVLAIPVTAAIKIVLDQIMPFKPIGTLMSNDVIKDQDRFLNEWDEEKYRLSSLFYHDKELPTQVNEKENKTSETENPDQ